MTARNRSAPPKRRTKEAVRASADNLDLRTARLRAERLVLMEAIIRTKGRIAPAAKLLGISRPTLYELLETHRLAPTALHQAVSRADPNPAQSGASKPTLEIRPVESTPRRTRSSRGKARHSNLSLPATVQPAAAPPEPSAATSENTALSDAASDWGPFGA
jgi:hypothetical protein